ncbi:hypothetical protein GOP47_0005032 [Adiantum capillus-veneris]|uniref:Protein kinase domain-containing protein n=1 Tax=Adiantum capillus-veneris TaxID=13818 RepID=A0A9D4ZL07_ADICA|nr:hypothetical protein GOP47_0005032 [Adiantum capillus-veneris]
MYWNMQVKKKQALRNDRLSQNDCEDGVVKQLTTIVKHLCTSLPCWAEMFNCNLHKIPFLFLHICISSVGHVMVERRQLGVVSILLLLSTIFVHALSPDGQALLKFKLAITSSDGTLANWNEDDKDPCLWPGVTCNLQTKQVIALNLPFRQLSGSIAPSLGNLTQLRKLGLHHNSLVGSIPPELGSCKKLKALYLQVNYLSGHIPGELGQLPKLMMLDLSSNSLSGNIPASLGDLSKLSLFNVSTNFLTGEIPEGGALSKFGSKSFLGNLKLCGLQVGAICISQLEGPSASPDTITTPLIGLEGVPPNGLPRKSRHYSTQVLVSALGTVGVSLLVALMCFWGCFLYHKFWKKSKPYNTFAEVEIPPDPKVVLFHGDLPYTSKEIVRKIESLGESSVIGYGGFGTVYKLVMDDSKVFAVKKIEKQNITDRFFERELEVLGSIKHRNLVNLRGYCNGPLARLLIYDYLPGGSLAEVLHEQDPAELSWASRLKIALGAAQGLAYLHHDCSPRIVHRDIKSSNILLGLNFEPHVSDFGLAKLLEDNETHVTTVIAGTFGYLAPEYLLNGRATEKADVYSYGVVLLELISGKRPTDSSFVEKGLNIVGWANSLMKEKRLKDIVHPSCECASMESLEAVLAIATMCIRSIPDERPTMHMVVKLLKAQSMSPCTSDFYESESE